MKKIIIINGTGGSGKDTFIDMITNYVNSTGNENAIENISSIDKPKEVAALLGWNGTKEEKDRLFLSNLKMLWIEYNDGANRYIKEKIKQFEQNKSKVLFIHIREPSEIIKLKYEIECETLLIDNGTTIKSNESDANIQNYNYNYHIMNDGSLEKLRTKAHAFAKIILKL